MFPDSGGKTGDAGVKGFSRAVFGGARQPPDFKAAPTKGVLFGGAADADTAYFALQNGGMAAVRLATARSSGTPP